MSKLFYIFIISVICAAVAYFVNLLRSPEPEKLDSSIYAALLEQPIINITDYGAVRGRVVRAANGRLAQEFLNLPYAQPPVGKLRFRHPVELLQNKEKLVWNGVRDGTQLGNACVQLSGPVMNWFFAQALFSFIPPRISEDCLNINIHVPHEKQNDNKKLLPVIVWLHGGVFKMGANSVPLLNGSVLASELGVIVVAPNFRIGPLGFFAVDGEDGIGGNQCLMDQSMALKWIHEHIAEFGGDPEQITLQGLSTGAASVHYHLLSHMSRKYFRRAIMQSGTALSFWGHQSPQQSRLEGRWFAEASGCNKTGDEIDLNCLQHLSVSNLLRTTLKLYLTKQHTAQFYPTTDGVFLTKSPAQHMREGDFKHAELMLGTSTFEMMALIAIFHPLSLMRALPDVRLSEDEFEDIVENAKSFIDDAPVEALAFVYRDWSKKKTKSSSAELKQHDGRAAERWTMLNDIADDVFIHNAVANILDAYVKFNQSKSLYRYVFEHKPTRNIFGLQLPTSSHGDDAAYFMGHALDPALKLTPVEVDLTMRILYGPLNNFLRTGNPNSANDDDDDTDRDSVWPHYAGQMDYFVIDTKPANTYGTIRFGPERWRAEFWRHAVPYLKQLKASAEAEENAEFPPRRRKRLPKSFYATFTNFIVPTAKAIVLKWILFTLPY